MDHDIQGHRLSLSKIKSNDLRKFDAFFRAFFLRFKCVFVEKCFQDVSDIISFLILYKINELQKGKTRYCFKFIPKRSCL